MSDGTKVNTEGGSGKQGGGQKNSFQNNNQPNKNSNSHTSNLRELETTTYIAIQFSLADRYDKSTKEIIRYVIRNLPGGVNLARGMCNRKLPNMFMYPNPKQ